VAGYEVLGVLGRGGMGVVYKARQVALNRLVALKMILAGAHAGPDELARFKAEAEAVAQLQHANIVQIYEVSEQDGRPFFSLEFVEGGSLDRQARGAPQPAARAARLMETLARAVYAAHRRGIIHRDLKPANVLLTADGTPKITDFGLAKKLDEDGQTHSGAVMGTPSYMPPEQAAGRTREIGPLADVYALGAVLYELLTGRPPFKGETLYDTLEQVCSQEPVAPRQLQPKVPRDLETVCLKCLQKEPRKRYATAQELADDLRRFLDGEAIEARPVSAWERTYKWARRRPAQAAFVVAGIAALLFAATGAVFYGLYQRQWALSERQQAIALTQRLARRETVHSRREQGLTAEKARQWDLAKENFDQALATLDSEPEADPAERRRLEEDRDRVVRELAALAARRDWQDRARRFEDEHHRGEVLFREVDFTERDRDANRAAIRRAAADALVALGLKDDDAPAEAARRLEAYRQHAERPRQVDEVAAECYQVLLVWAEAEAPAPGGADEAGARRALRLLDLAAALGKAHDLPTPRAFHVRRARYLALLGDDAGAGAERALADRQQPDTALDLFLTALDLYRQKDSVQAASACARVLRLEPDHFWAQYLQAVCYLHTKRWAEAKAGLTACLSHQPSFFWAQLLRATAESQLADWEAAEDDFAAVLGRPRDGLARSVALTNRGAMWGQRKRWDEAAADLREAIGLRPEAPEAYLSLAQVHRARKDWDAAVTVLDQALARRPDDPLLYHTRAELHRDRGDPAGARRDFERAVAHEPEGSTSERLASDGVELAHLQHQAGEYDAALASCDAALRVRPDYTAAYRQRAKTLLALKRYGEAGEALDRCVREGARTPEVYEARGLIHAEQRQYDAAVEDYSRALTLKQDPKTLSFRGWAYLKLDAPRPAQADFEAALKLDPAQTDALCGRGRARASLGQVRAAVEDAEAVLRAGQPTAQLLLQAACIYGRAVGYLEAQAGGGPGAAGTAYRYQARSVELLRAALEQVPAAQRPAFWRANVPHEPDLLPVSRSSEMLALTRSYAR
jgi:tetratricopeptide (TPR) repeat protein/predicted Ser/Thr protein kinase